MKTTINKALALYGLEGVHPAANLFPMMSDEEYKGLCDDARLNGWIQPVIVTSDNLLLDGRNRICASVEIEKDVPMKRIDPPDPVAYVLGLNLHRRQLSTGQKAFVALEVKKIYEAEAKERQGNRNDLKPNIPTDPVECIQEPQHNRESARRAAKVMGIGSTSVRQAQKLADDAPEMAEKVKQGELSIDRAYNMVKAAEQKMPKPEPVPDAQKPGDWDEKIETPDGILYVLHRPNSNPILNRTNDSVDWAWWTWNPVTGCWHGCNYCYAREIANSERMASAYPYKFEPTFHPARLNAVKGKKPPESDDPRAKNIFTCSMADLFGKWVPDEWILQVFEVVRDCPDWNFLFLTKFPQRLQDICDQLGGYPDNAWVGTTVDTQARVRVAEKAFQNINAGVKWLSCEPMLEPLQFHSLEMFDWVVIGGQSASYYNKTPEFQPEWEWVESLWDQARASNTLVYWKENLSVRPKQTPWSR